MKSEEHQAITRRSFLGNTAKGILATSALVSGFPTIVPASVFGKMPQVTESISEQLG